MVITKTGSSKGARLLPGQPSAMPGVRSGTGPPRPTNPCSPHAPVSHHAADGCQREGGQEPNEHYCGEGQPAAAAELLHHDQCGNVAEPGAHIVNRLGGPQQPEVAVDAQAAVLVSEAVRLLCAGGGGGGTAAAGGGGGGVARHATSAMFTNASQTGGCRGAGRAAPGAGAGSYGCWCATAGMWGMGG